MRLGLILFLGLGVVATARAADPVVIVEPVDGATVPPQFTVRVKYGDLSVCDTGGCYDTPVDSVGLYAGENVVLLDSCSSCPDGMVSFDISLSPGSHEIYAIAEASFVIQQSEHITIEVEGAGSTGEGATGSGDSSSKSGCGCHLSGGRAASVGGGLVCLWLWRSRRRRFGWGGQKDMS